MALQYKHFRTHILCLVPSIGQRRDGLYSVRALEGPGALLSTSLRACVYSVQEATVLGEKGTLTDLYSLIY